MHDDIPKEDEDDAAFRRLRITLRVRPRRVAVPELQRIGTSLHPQKRTANSSSMHRSVSMAALALALANFFHYRHCVVNTCNNGFGTFREKKND